MNTMDKLSHAVQRKTVGAMIDVVLNKMSKDREKSLLQLVDLAEQFWGNGFPKESYDKARTALQDPNNRWVQFLSHVVDETDPHVAKMALLNLGYEAFFPRHQDNPQEQRDL